MVNNGELTHWGKKGMKWGVRRYQNEDGSLTDAGRKRYARDAREKNYNEMDDDGKHYKWTGDKKNKKETLDVDAGRYVKEDLSRTRRLADETSGLTNKLKQANDKAIKDRPKPKMDLSNMSDKEMRDAINRAYLEKQYTDMFAPQTTSKGREFANNILENAGAVLGVTSSALGIALAIKELRG